MNNHLELLKKELAHLDSALKVYDYSYQACRSIGIKDRYTYDELDRFEALTARFARLSDMIIQKMFRLIDTLDLENPGTVRDRINRAEKKGLIESADTFIQIRIVRNDIAHEYLPEAVQEIYGKVLDLSPPLMECVPKLKNYCERYGSS